MSINSHIKTTEEWTSKTARAKEHTPMKGLMTLCLYIGLVIYKVINQLLCGCKFFSYFQRILTMSGSRISSVSHLNPVGRE